MENNNQKRVIFEGEKDPNDIIEEILKNNGLEETSDDYLNKIEQKKDSWFDILYKSAKNLAGGTTEINFLTDIQKQLNISEQISKNILQEVKEKLLPMAKIISEDEIEKETYTGKPVRPIEQPIAANISLPKKEEIEPLTPTPTTPVVKTVRSTKKPIKKIEQPEVKQDTPLQQKNRNDTYREPIE